MVEFASATVVITTKNRKEALRNAITSALSQSARPEVIVIDDGSSDGTSDMVHAEFPQARVYRVEVSLGLIRQRNRGAQLATGDVIFSIDDDAAFSSPHVVSQTLAEFDDPRVGAVAIPFVNVNQDDVVRQRAPDDRDVYVCAHYIGTAHAVRRSLFLELAGYRGELVHQGEEGDFCIRMLDSGFLVKMGTADPIYHYESPKRDSSRMAYYGRRNDIFFAVHNVPFPQFVVHLVGTTMSGLRFIWRRRANGTVFAGLKGILAGYAGVISNWRARAPVKRATYLLYRRIKRVGSLPLREFESELDRL